MSVQRTDQEIESLIDRWHAGDGGGEELHAFLGMTKKEYADWVTRRYKPPVHKRGKNNWSDQFKLPETEGNPLWPGFVAWSETHLPKGTMILAVWWDCFRAGAREYQQQQKAQRQKFIDLEEHLGGGI